MIDPFGRHISYLRVSVTDRCDLRCVYCMAEDMTFLPKAEVLTLEELERLCGAFITMGVKKIRLTGGEPLVRRNVMSLVEALGRLEFAPTISASPAAFAAQIRAEREMWGPIIRNSGFKPE
jgi:cyclic pyranopterin phosphate synthase